MVLGTERKMRRVYLSLCLLPPLMTSGGNAEGLTFCLQPIEEVVMALHAKEER